MDGKIGRKREENGIRPTPLAGTSDIYGPIRHLPGPTIPSSGMQRTWWQDPSSPDLLPWQPSYRAGKCPSAWTEALWSWEAAMGWLGRRWPSERSGPDPVFFSLSSYFPVHLLLPFPFRFLVSSTRVQKSLSAFG